MTGQHTLGREELSIDRQPQASEDRIVGLRGRVRPAVTGPDPSSVELAARVARQREALRHVASGRAAEVRVAVAPYRVCPIGAHVDHQNGPVLGMAISAGTVLAFAPSGGSWVRAVSDDFEGEERFDLTGELEPGGGWGDYLRGAAWALGPRLPAEPVGLVASVGGSLPGGGLSSSASVLVAYLLALADVNGIELSPAEIVALARRAENRFVGVASGILDPASVVGSRRGRLLAIDTRGASWEPIELGGRAEPPRVLVAFTGTSRNLAQTPFNERVSDCRRAAARLAERAGRDGVEVLGDLPDEVFQAHGDALPPAERGRARHFFGERERVRRGIEAWRAGDLAVFGSLMAASCRSSIENYETGSPEQIALQQILLDTPGVYGARFSGAGFGGCSLALVETGRAEEAGRRAEEAFVARFPELRGRARVFGVDTEDGARLARGD